MTIKFQKRILDNYRNGIVTTRGDFAYYIQYHPLGYNHTWIIRAKLDKYDRYGGFEFYMPLDPAVN